MLSHYVREDTITSHRSYINDRPANINRRARTYTSPPSAKKINHSENAPSKKKSQTSCSSSHEEKASLPHRSEQNDRREQWPVLQATDDQSRLKRASQRIGRRNTYVMPRTTRSTCKSTRQGGSGDGVMWHARAHTVYLYVRFVAGTCDFLVDRFVKRTMLSARARRQGRSGDGGGGGGYLYG